jgi:LmbE family N-acetylglucosaminyl deacetylase
MKTKNKMRILVIAPHPDDEVLGCGGTIKKYTEKGDEVFLIVATKGYKPDWSETFLKNIKKWTASAAKKLGIKEVFYLDFPTAKLDTVPQKEINDVILQYLKKISPQILFLPHYGDVSKDHCLIFESTMIAARPKPNNKIKKIFSYEVLSETDWRSAGNSFSPNFYVDISQTLKDKLKAMSYYKTELKDFPHPRSLKAITALAQKRGSEAGLKAAEAFILVREIL